jgi:hypothetical protein
MPTRRTPAPRSKKDKPIVGFLGVGLDNEDGHSRVTKGNDFTLVGGSEETHERMQGLVIRMNEKLKSKGKRITDLTHHEFEELAGESFE